MKASSSEEYDRAWERGVDGTSQDRPPPGPPGGGGRDPAWPRVWFYPQPTLRVREDGCSRNSGTTIMEGAACRWQAVPTPGSRISGDSPSLVAG